MWWAKNLKIFAQSTNSKTTLHLLHEARELFAEWRKPMPELETEKHTAQAKKSPRYMTRREAAKYASEVLGVPVRASTIAKKAMKGAGPKPDSFYGRVELFTPETIESWVLSELCADRPTKLDAA
jgi:hypothetical protein